MLYFAARFLIECPSDKHLRNSDLSQRDYSFELKEKNNSSSEKESDYYSECIFLRMFI